ncbi:uncharacterized protein with WD repeat [Streptomyces luteogriseus]|nr:uncharacterized protein with WD repeat [Streptomyces luteogriseus]
MVRESDLERAARSCPWSSGARRQGFECLVVGTERRFALFGRARIGAEDGGKMSDPPHPGRTAVAPFDDAGTYMHPKIRGAFETFHPNGGR